MGLRVALDRWPTHPRPREGDGHCLRVLPPHRRDTRHEPPALGGRSSWLLYKWVVLLLSLVDDPENGRPLWTIEFDGVLAGRFDSKEEVASYLRGLGHQIDADDEWPTHRLL
jgi:hypothetical protein